MKKRMHILQEKLITFLFLTLDPNCSKTLSFLLQLLNGTIQILPFGTQKVLLFKKNSIQRFIRLSSCDVFHYHNHKGIRLITRLHAVLIHLHEHRFKHNFQYCLNPLCCCGLDIKSTSHFVLHCPALNNERYTLLGPLYKIYCKLIELTNFSLSQTLLYGYTLCEKEKSTHRYLQ